MRAVYPTNLPELMISYLQIKQITISRNIDFSVIFYFLLTVFL